MRALLAFGVVFLATVGFGQSPTRIDGRMHPELIPDGSAYRAVFLMHSHFATAQETARSEQFHARFGFSAMDHQAYDQALRDFRQQYDNLVQMHDAFAASSSSMSLDSIHAEMASFLQSVSALVETTHSELVARLTVERDCQVGCLCSI